MRTLTFDAAEFDSLDPEEEVQVIISTPQDLRHRTLAEFADDVVAEGTGRRLLMPVAFSSLPTFELDRRRLRQIASIDAPDQCAWPCFTISDDWNWRHYVLDAGNGFISYRWSTSS